MKSAARPWSAVAKQGCHGTERSKPLPAGSVGMRTSKSSTSLVFDSRLSKLKRASSEDMLTKPGLIAATGGSRLKKTITTGAISELAENRLRPSTGSIPSSKRTGIPAPRELPTAVAREKAVARPRKTQPSPTSSGTPTPTKHLRPLVKLKNEPEPGEKAVLESQVKELLAEAKTKDSEITRLRGELKKRQEKEALGLDAAGVPDPSTEAAALSSPAGTEPSIRALQEKNRTFQKELLALGEENRLLKEKLSQLEAQVSLSESSGGSSSLPTPTTQESSFRSPAGHPRGDGGLPLRHSGSSSSDVTKASLSPDASDFEHIMDVPSRPASSGSHPCKSSRCSTSGSSPNNASDLSVASLTERIHRMEENHHCTAEELQATLQELSDQQQVVQELTAENEKLAEEKAMLETSFCQHRERAEKLSQENEKLAALLQERPKGDESQVRELRQKAQFEREKMLNIQQQLTSSLRSLEREHQDAQAAGKSLREENERLAALLEAERQGSAALARTLEDCKVSLEGLKIESGSLRSQLDSARQKAASMDPAGGGANGSGLQELLKAARAEKDQLELACTEVRQELLRAHSEVKTAQGQLAKVEKECRQLKETCDRQAEQLSCASVKLQEKMSENETEIKNLKETIFELEDQVEQHRALKLHDNQTISDLESNLLKLEDQKLDLERQLKSLNKQIKEDTEDWRRFQADLQTAVVVANDIKCEAQQDLRIAKRRLLEEEEKSARLQKELEEAQGSSSHAYRAPPTLSPPENPQFPEERPVNPRGLRSTPELKLSRLAKPHAGSPRSLKKQLVPTPTEAIYCSEAEPTNRWQGVPVSHTSPTPPESLATVKSLIKSFDLGCPGGTGQTVPVHKVSRSPLSGIPTRTAPAAAVSPIQRHSTFSHSKPPGKTFSKHADLPELPLADLLKGRGEDLKPDHFLCKSPSLESLSKPASVAFAGQVLTSMPSSLKPPSKLSVERKDPLAALAREYGGSKRNALLKWCQKKTEGYPNIDITNFSSSWSDGLAFCALLHTYLPAHIPYQELNSQDKKRNLLLAFQAAESVGIKPSLELSEIMYTDRPDWQSVMHYVAQIYKYFET